jgi:hypothetical protein
MVTTSALQSLSPVQRLRDMYWSVLLPFYSLTVYHPLETYDNTKAQTCGYDMACNFLPEQNFRSADFDRIYV